MNLLTQFAETAAHEQSGGLFGALGIEWQMLVFQMLAFIILVLLLGKFIFPILIKSVDDRKAKIDEGAKAAEAAAKKAENAQADVEKALQQARVEARDIVSTAKDEATAMVAKAESSAKSKSERIVAQAQEEISKEIEKAKKALESDTLALVKKATGAVTAHVADDKVDAAIVKKSVEGAKR